MTKVQTISQHVGRVCIEIVSYVQKLVHVIVRGNPEASFKGYIGIYLVLIAHWKFTYEKG
jgi:hypothetical protein